MNDESVPPAQQPSTPGPGRQSPGQQFTPPSSSSAANPPIAPGAEIYLPPQGSQTQFSMGYPMSQVEPKKPRKALLFSLLGAGLVVVLVLISAAIWIIGANDRNAPAKQVDAFLTALVQGQAEAAMRLSGNELATADKTLINDAVYAKATDRISSFSIDKTTIENGTATVQTTISQGADSYPQDFSLVTDGKDFFVDKWKLNPVTLQSANIQLLGPASLGLTVAGVELHPVVAPAGQNLPEQLKKLNLKALPGTYPVAAAKQDPTVTTDKSNLKVNGFGTIKTQDAVVTATLTAEGQASITDAANKYLDSCTAQQSVVLTGCPFSGRADDPIVTQYTVTNAHWTILSRPTLKILEWSPVLGWAVISSAPGSASFTADISDGARVGKATIDASSFTLTGQVLSFKGGVAQFSRPETPTA
ncbi:hypothetical membrane protein [Renibacterium salmoninarum ATCC 33209]|uniref:Hypothetical membrane protein n=1 Tax=Renibacterium salmoninarum (strain ATCC 33209 / DSM 20767 / JCM 11484 / NBRC 15589 / NCIMB 2235) TaxID=288705 RepID=A9WSX8_RENSM|nr:hypothetical protein [Renibacterium salmoninarum]ABY23916.1 hypothetical membrane protein [Renibacterium salmoninarum ATCC 33209]